jgi:hypothetical protein
VAGAEKARQLTVLHTFCVPRFLELEYAEDQGNPGVVNPEASSVLGRKSCDL